MGCHKLTARLEDPRSEMGGGFFFALERPAAAASLRGCDVNDLGAGLWGLLRVGAARRVAEETDGGG